MKDGVLGLDFSDNLHVTIEPRAENHTRCVTKLNQRTNNSPHALTVSSSQGRHEGPEDAEKQHRRG